MSVQNDLLTSAYLKRLNRPEGRVDVVMDTDTYNEIDDQFALSYALKSTEAIRMQAVYAAPFHNARSDGPAEGMELSYKEILRILPLCGREDLIPFTFKGSPSFLADEKTPIISDAVNDLVSRSKQYSSENPLYVVALGAITNIASALLLDETLYERIVVVWLGGHALEWPDTKEFNMMQDVAAARVLFNSGVPLVQLPCMGVVSSFTISAPEMNAWLKGRNALCDYLVDATVGEALTYVKSDIWTRVIWDVTAVAWLVSQDFVSDRLEHLPLPAYDHAYVLRKDHGFYRYVYHINKDSLMQDLVKKLTS